MRYMIETSIYRFAGRMFLITKLAQVIVPRNMFLLVKVEQNER